MKASRATLTVSTPTKYIEQAFRYTVGTNTMSRSTILAQLTRYQKLGCVKATEWIAVVKSSN